ncbi:amidase [Actinomycetospora sp. TBRC 11914]|uniref:amidase n=1 Tax=Actinomycetospora sp. TBRC 11914 TaxID=2729387 RepID=UPI00145D2BDB|nr:amidase family protein [Actinomycetospora sp. TBRC 11914]NMO89322.1 amidase [Actinomycetospora sp. TBRC 11914]
MTTATDVTGMTATAMAAAIRGGALSPVEATEAALARIEALDPTLHAFCELTAEHARATARSVADALARGDDPGPLAGVPIAVKDLIATAGIPTRSGSPAYEHFVPDEDDVVVERVRDAGAVILGKTTVPEFGYSAVGHNPISPTARNPWNPSLTPGGSSAGSGVAVATGMAPLALGSDGGGSVRIPAAHCGIVGFKASMGRVPAYPGCRDERYPGVSSWESLEHIGPMTRTVDDAALLMSVLAGPDPRDRHSLPAGDVSWVDAPRGGVRGLRVAYSADWGYLAVDPQVREVVATAAAVFARDLGCEVTEADPGWDDPSGAFWAMVIGDTDLTGMRAMVAEHGARMSPHLVDLITRPWTAEKLTDAQVTRKHVVNRMWRFMRSYDLLLTPTLTVPPFPVAMQGPEEVDGRMVPSSAWLGFTQPMNMTGQPAISVPAGVTRDGLPVGLQIVGRHLADADVLRAAAAYEQAAPWADRLPVVTP